jgi:TP901 family phage tail tape measure protein
VSRVAIEFFGVDAGASAETKKAIAQLEQLRATTNQTTKAAESSAEASASAAETKVAALVEERGAIRANLVAYQALAASATAGSEEQVAATQLAVGAQRELGITAKATATSITAGATKAAGSMKKLLTPVLAIGGGAAFMAASFETSMQRIRTGAGASQAEVDRMSKAVLEMASTAAGAGQSPVALSKALYMIESSGIRGAAALRVLSAAAVNASTTGADLTEVTKALTSAVNTGIGGAEDETKAMGVLNAVVGSGKMTMDDLTGALSTGILPAAKNVGITLPQVGAALDTFTLAGVPAQQAATKLTATFLRMESPTGAAAKGLAALGIKSQDLAISLQRGGLTAALALLVKHYDATTKASGKVYATQQLMAAFGRSRGGAAILALVQGYDTYNRSLQKVNRTTLDYQRNSKAAMQTPAMKAKIAISSLEASLIKLGAEVLPPFARMAESVANLVHSLNGLGTVFAAIVLSALAAKVAIATFYTFARVGAIVTAGVIDDALVTTGIGAFVVALGVATVLVAKNMGAIRAEFRAFGNWLKREAITTELAFVEPYSHLPGDLGEWARKAKVALNAQLVAMQIDAAAKGTAIGQMIGSHLMQAALPGIKQTKAAIDGIQGPKTGDVGGVTGPQKGNLGKGTTGVVALAKAFGVGSGAVYQTGGGHGGTSKPGSVLDCSGYIYQIFTQSGFESFPGTSETQWATGSGPNWASERINPSTAKPGDVVFMVGSPKYPSPGHVGIVTSGSGGSAEVMQYYSSGKPAKTEKLSSIGDIVGVKRFYLVKKAAKTTTPGDTSYNPPAAAPSASAKNKAATFKEDKATDQSYARSLAKSVEKIVSPTLRTNLRKQVSDLNKELDNVGSQKELDKLEKRATKIAAALKKALALNSVSKQLRADAKTLMALVQELPADVAGPLAASLAALIKKTGDVSSKAMAKTLQKQLDAIQKAYEKALQKLEDTVDSKRDAFSGAWSRLVDDALQVFDAGTQELLDASDKAYDDQTKAAEAANALDTPNEAKLKVLETLGTTTDNQNATTDAQKALDDAHKLRAGWDGTQSEIEQKIQDAERALAAAQLAQQEQDVGTQADAERKAADDVLTVQEDAIQKQKDLADKAIQDQRDALRQALSDRLDLIQTEFESDEPDVVAQGQRDLAALLADPDFKQLFSDSGSLIGQYFAAGFTTALDAITKAVQDLTQAITAVATASGYTPSHVAVIPANPNAPYGGTGAGGGIGYTGYASGGKVGGIFVGRQDTVAARLTPGETVIDRGLTSALADYLDGGGSGVHVHNHFHGPVFGGRDKVAKEFAPAMQSAMDRIVRSRSRRG